MDLPRPLKVLGSADADLVFAILLRGVERLVGLVESLAEAVLMLVEHFGDTDTGGHLEAVRESEPIIASHIGLEALAERPSLSGKRVRQDDDEFVAAIPTQDVLVADERLPQIL